MASPDRLKDRRAFLSFLAASPVLAWAGFTSRWVEDVMAEPLAPQATAALGAQNDAVIKSGRENSNFFFFFFFVRGAFSPPHSTVITDGSFNNETLRANREGFNKYELRLRRLTGITKVDPSVRLFGVSWDSPIFFSPVGRMNAYYPQGAVVVARAAKATRTLQILAGSAAILVDPKIMGAVTAAGAEPG